MESQLHIKCIEHGHDTQNASLPHLDSRCVTLSPSLSTGTSHSRKIIILRRLLAVWHSFCAVSALCRFGLTWMPVTLGAHSSIYEIMRLRAALIMQPLAPNLAEIESIAATTHKVFILNGACTSKSKWNVIEWALNQFLSILWELNMMRQWFAVFVSANMSTGEPVFSSSSLF